MKRPTSFAAVAAAACLATGGFVYAAKDEPFALVVGICAVLAFVFGGLALAAADED